MPKNFLSFLCLLSFSLTLPLSVKARQDLKGSADLPLISRFAGASIVGYDHKIYDEATLALGPTINQPTASGNHFNLKKTKVAAGEVTRILYDIPGDHSALEVFANYRKALKKGGFKILFYCRDSGNSMYKQGGQGCGWMFFNTPAFPQLREYEFEGVGAKHSVTAVLKKGGKQIFLAVTIFEKSDYPGWASGHVWVRQDSLQTALVKDNTLRVDASALGRALDKQGHVAVEGLFFDSGKDTLLSRSAPALKEILALLKKQPRLQLWVVGHSDARGALTYNMDLSKRRAGAVIAALVKKGIQRSRLSPKGLGPLAPVASNKNSAGRSKNRRVELVPRP